MVARPRLAGRQGPGLLQQGGLSCKGPRALVALGVREGDAHQPGRASVRWASRQKHDHWSGVHCRAAANGQQRRQCRNQPGWGSGLGLAILVPPFTSCVVLGTSLSLGSLLKRGITRVPAPWEGAGGRVRCTRRDRLLACVRFSGPFWFPDAHPHPSLFLSSGSDPRPKHPKPFIHFLP